MLLVLQKVWEFIKKYWQFFAGFAVALLLFLFSIRRSNPAKPIDTSVQKKVEEETQKKEDQAAKDRDQQVQKAQDEHDAKVDAVVTEEKKDSGSLVDDPKATNDFLNQVGKDIRGG